MKARGENTLKTPVLIVGGGPSGMTAALGLAACGVASIIVEKHEQPARHPKAHEISARTIEILTSLGVSMAELVRESSPHEDASRILFCRTLGEELGRIDLGEKDIAAKYAAHTATARPYLNLSQTELEKILRRRVKATKKIKLLTAVEWLSLRQNAEGVVSLARNAATGLVTVRHGSGSGDARRVAPQVEIHSQYLLCCDGAGGKCRNALGITMHGPEKIQDFANAYFTDDLRGRLKTKAKLFFIFKPDAAGTFIAHHASRRWVYHVPVMTPHEKIEDFTEDVFRERIASALGDPDFKANIESISSWRMTAQIAESFQSGHAFLIGDSAHRFPPTGGLGLNSGVADAHNLAWKIAAVIQGGASATLAATYESERRPVVALNCEESRRNYFNLFDIPRSLGLNAALLPRVMALLAHAPLRWFGRKFRAVFLRALYRMADNRLRRYWKNTQRAARTRGVVHDQHSHFDRIGLDLGYVYSDGAVIANGERPCFSAVSEYRPSFAPGARLPVFHWLVRGKKKTSTQALRYERFTLLTDSAADAWKKSAHIAGLNLNIVTVAPQITLGGSKINWHEAAKGALLVRPDGHIAAVMADGAADQVSALRAVFAQLGYAMKQPVLSRRAS